MPSNKRQRELARRRAERQAARRAAERARRRRRRTVLGLSIGGVAAGVVLLLVLLSFLGSDDKDTIDPAASATPTTTPSGPCGVVADTASQTAGKKPGLPPAPAFGATKTVKGTLVLDSGTVQLELFADRAPCTVTSFKHLASKKFFDGTQCHRATSSPALTVLQCGDPTATGSGGPGYRFKDENLPKVPAGSNTKYTRGTVAMANSGPATNGSQFFLVTKDSTLPPNYTVFGKITAGLDVLDKIIAAGTEPAGDGKPKKTVTIKSFTLT